MSKKKRILVPVDFSPCSENAVKYAVALAIKLEATLELLHVAIYDAPALDYPSFVDVAMEIKVENSQKLMNQLLEKMENEFGKATMEKIATELHFELGLPVKKIVGMAKEKQCDFIVMGTQGEHSLLERFLGSVSTQVLQETPCPVFVIPEKAKFEKDMIMGYATDFMEADAFEIWKASKLLEPFDAPIKCIHLNKKQEFIINKIEALEAYFADTAPQLQISFYSLYPQDRVEDLNNFIERQEINLMVMYKPKRKFLESIFHQSFTKEMALHIEIPLLVLREH